ncbi:hypothetical protein [Brevibacillus sp. Leaf182]|uniref:hypothetical protein n=1 Tax=Brevibacillus sp. Leaf182 TaxID=1736290 RepID=UPI0006F7FD36|nr:hypothetical protein [Brevibacillus sp. Leaf182]RAT94694.1 hypothetical protein ASG16_027440 [Brevibacillus sp. Leaf182]
MLGDDTWLLLGFFHTQMRIKTQYLFDHHVASQKIGEGTYLKVAPRLLRLDHRRNTISMEDQ